MFGRKPGRASAETGIDLDALLDDAIERVAKREAAGDKPKTPATSRGEAMSRAVQSRSTANNSASQREKASESYRASREARSAAFIGKVSSRGGMPIKELHAPFAGEEDRYLLAGFVASALNAGIRKQSQEPNTIFSGTVAGKFVDPLSAFRGWELDLGRFTYHYDTSNHVAKHNGIVTPYYNLFVSQGELTSDVFGMPRNGRRIMDRIQTSVLRESVVTILGDHGAEWVEPDPAIYENR